MKEVFFVGRYLVLFDLLRLSPASGMLCSLAESALVLFWAHGWHLCISLILLWQILGFVMDRNVLVKFLGVFRLRIVSASFDGLQLAQTQTY